jgi:hypothetical protein
MYRTGREYGFTDREAGVPILSGCYVGGGFGIRT